jgi:hypothetical protein
MVEMRNGLKIWMISVSRTLCFATLAACGSVAGAPAFGQEIATDTPVSTPLPQVRLYQRDGGFVVEFSNAPRRQVAERLFGSIGASVEWRDQAYADQLVEGLLSGSMENITDRFLENSNHLTTLRAVGGEVRITGVVIIGPKEMGDASGNSKAAPRSGTREYSTECDIASLDSSASIGLDNGMFLMIGYENGCRVAGARSTELYDPATGQLRRVGPMSVARADFATAKSNNGDILVFGGRIPGGLLAVTETIERFEAETGNWSIAGRLSEAKAGAVICEMADGTLLVAGGYADGDNASLRSADVYDPSDNTVHATKSAMQQTHAGAMSALRLRDDRCIIASLGNGLRAEIFDPETEAFTELATPEGEGASPEPAFLAILPNGAVLITGTTPMIYDPANDTFRNVPN